MGCSDSKGSKPKKSQECLPPPRSNQPMPQINNKLPQKNVLQLKDPRDQLSLQKSVRLLKLRAKFYQMLRMKNLQVLGKKLEMVAEKSEQNEGNQSSRTVLRASFNKQFPQANIQMEMSTLEIYINKQQKSECPFNNNDITQSSPENQSPTLKSRLDPAESKIQLVQQFSIQHCKKMNNYRRQTNKTDAHNNLSLLIQTLLIKSDKVISNYLSKKRGGDMQNFVRIE